MNNCKPLHALWVEILDQRLGEKKTFSSQERFFWDASRCTLIYTSTYLWQEVEWVYGLMCIPLIRGVKVLHFNNGSK